LKVGGGEQNKGKNEEISRLKSLKVLFTNFVIEQLCLDPDWIGSVLSNRLDPDPNSVNTDPKHRIRQGTVPYSPDKKHFHIKNDMN
jgi:hypothetical protein